MTSQAATLELSHALAVELHGLFRVLERRIQTPDLVKDKFEAAMRQLEALLEMEWNLVPEAVAESIQRIAELLREWTPDDVDTWTELKVQLRETYAALSTALRREQVVVPELRPTNYVRSAFHVSAALVCLVLVTQLPPAQLLVVAAAFAGSGWLMEGSRRVSTRANDVMMTIFGPVAHPQERERINSATWYTTALVLLALTFSPLVSAVAVAVLGFGDPVAGLVGRRWGRIKLIANRSLEGTLAFALVGTLAARGAMMLVETSAPSGAQWIIAAGAASAGALAELLSRRIDDNLSVPLAAAGTAALLMTLLGVSLWGV